MRGSGAVLCDGIVSDRRPTGYVLNLTGPRAGRLSVDRKTLQEYDREWETVTCLAGLDALIAWPRISMEWFWHLELRELPLARALWPRLKDRGLAVPVAVEREEEGRYVRLGEAGWCHLDRDPYAADLHRLSSSVSLRAHRLAHGCPVGGPDLGGAGAAAPPHGLPRRRTRGLRQGRGPGRRLEGGPAGGIRPGSEPGRLPARGTRSADLPPGAGRSTPGTGVGAVRPVRR
ncbi:hypothetical protein GCM10020229_18070 [Kitasatospora albolonga]